MKRIHSKVPRSPKNIEKHCMKLPS